MKPVRYIAKCRACGVASSALLTGHPLAPKRGDLVPPGAVHFDDTGRSGSFGGLAVLCRKCGEPRRAVMVRGVYSARHVCSARCTSSTGTSCECSCGGKNHGAGHA